MFVYKIVLIFVISWSKRGEAENYPCRQYYCESESTLTRCYRVTRHEDTLGYLPSDNTCNLRNIECEQGIEYKDAIVEEVPISHCDSYSYPRHRIIKDRNRQQPTIKPLISLDYYFDFDRDADHNARQRSKTREADVNTEAVATTTCKPKRTPLTSWDYFLSLSDMFQDSEESPNHYVYNKPQIHKSKIKKTKKKKQKMLISYEYLLGVVDDNDNHYF